jgi:prepilin signal peptidase PulO-like enzyme (type II secretory pathway)
VLALVVFGPISAMSRRLIPLGVFLAAGAGVAYVWSDAMIRWYLSAVIGV